MQIVRTKEKQFLSSFEAKTWNPCLSLPVLLYIIFLDTQCMHSYTYTHFNIKIHPWKWTWNITMEVWKIIFLSKWMICRFQPLIFQGVVFVFFFFVFFGIGSLSFTSEPRKKWYQQTAWTSRVGTSWFLEHLSYHTNRKQPNWWV